MKVDRLLLMYDPLSRDLQFEGEGGGEGRREEGLNADESYVADR